MNTPAYKSLLVATLLLSASACHVSHSEFVGTGPSFPPPPSVLPEVEVNDFAWAPNSVGWVSGGDTVIIEGAITDQGWDPRDGFQFFATEPLVVNVSLDGHVFGTDLDWCVWDPTVGDFTVCAETEFNPEIGSFIVVPPGNEFHIVVSSYLGTTTYSMTVSFSTYFGAEAASGPSGLEATPLTVSPRTAGLTEYGTDHRGEVPAPDSPLIKSLEALEPVFSGPLFELGSE
jgi:hypothetical protein